MELSETVAPFVAQRMAQKVDRVHEEQVRASVDCAVWVDSRLWRRILALEGLIA